MVVQGHNSSRTSVGLDAPALVRTIMETTAVCWALPPLSICFWFHSQVADRLTMIGVRTQAPYTIRTKVTPGPNPSKLIRSLVRFAPGNGNQTSGGSQQKLAILTRALTVQSQQSHFIALAGLSRTTFVVPVHNIFDPDLQNLGDSGQIRCDLSGAAGFPLCHRTA